MTAYRKLPVVIEAMGPLNAENLVEIMAWSGAGLAHQGIVSLMLPTLEGNMLASEGDYVICGVKGEFYPCKPDIFEATYEAAPVEVN